MAIARLCLVVACLALLGGCTRAAAAPAGEASLEEQLHEMGRLLYSLSSIYDALLKRTRFRARWPANVHHPKRRTS